MLPHWLCLKNKLSVFPTYSNSDALSTNTLPSSIFRDLKQNVEQPMIRWTGNISHINKRSCSAESCLVRLTWMRAFLSSFLLNPAVWRAGRTRSERFLGYHWADAGPAPRLLPSPSTGGYTWEILVSFSQHTRTLICSMCSLCSAQSEHLYFLF